MYGVKPMRRQGSESRLRTIRSEIIPYTKAKETHEGPGVSVQWLAGGRRVCLWSRALTNGASVVSQRRLRTEPAATPGRNGVTGAFNHSLHESSSREDQRHEKRSGESAGNRRRERLVGQEVIGHGMRTGLGSGWRQIVGSTRGRTLALFQQPAREHRAGIFVEPLIEQGSNFLAKVSGVT